MYPGDEDVDEILEDADKFDEDVDMDMAIEEDTNGGLYTLLLLLFDICFGASKQLCVDLLFLLFSVAVDVAEGR